MLYLDFRLYMFARKILQTLEESRRALDYDTQSPDEYPGELRRHALVESVHFSTRIEGNTLTFEQVEAVLAGRRVSAPQGQVQEVENYRDALLYLKSLILNGETIITEKNHQDH